MQTGALRQLDIKVKQCMYKCVPGYKIKHLCENLTVGLVYTCDFVWLQKNIIISNIIITNIYFQCLVDTHSSNPEARELV